MAQEKSTYRCKILTSSHLAMTEPAKARRLHLYSLGLIVSAACLPSHSAHAGILSDIRHSISSLWGQKASRQQQARQAYARAGAAKQQAEFAHDRLEKTQQLLLTATATYNNYYRQVRATEARIVETRHRIQIAEKSYRKHRALFAQRLGVMQRYGRPSYLQVVFGSQSLSDLTRRTATYRAITEQDAAMQAQLSSDRQELELAQNALESQWSQRKGLLRSVDRERARIAGARQDQEAAWKKLNSSRYELVAYAQAQEQSSEEIGTMIGQLESRRSEIIAQYEAQAAEQRRQAAIARARIRRANRVRYASRVRVESDAPRLAPRVRLANAELAPMPIEDLDEHAHEVPPAGGDGWVMPARGRLSSRYGMRFHPVLRRTKLHTGDDIAAAMGSPIRAARSGRVLWAGWKKAYGNTIIVDVGNGMTVLYGHASKLGVRAGQPVAAGEYIGNVGSTGWSTGPHLHFEVRKNGKPVDPTSYLRRSR